MGIFNQINSLGSSYLVAENEGQKRLLSRLRFARNDSRFCSHCMLSSLFPAVAFGSSHASAVVSGGFHHTVDQIIPNDSVRISTLDDLLEIRPDGV